MLMPGVLVDSYILTLMIIRLEKIKWLNLQDNYQEIQIPGFDPFNDLLYNFLFKNKHMHTTEDGTDRINIPNPKFENSYWSKSNL